MLRPSTRSAWLAWLLVAALAGAPAARAADRPAESNPGEIDAEKFFGAFVKVHATALPDARTAAALGTEREGTGIVIDNDGLIVTVGYLVIEADEITINDHRGRTLPASVVGYDYASGLALLRSIVPFEAVPLPMGDSTRLDESTPVLVVNYAGRSDVTPAYVVSRRAFTGNWEYLLDRAIFTSPPAPNSSGAALVGVDGSLLGIGSLILRDATDAEPHLPGNLFVPIELLKPILPDLVRSGHRPGPGGPGWVWPRTRSRGACW